MLIYFPIFYYQRHSISHKIWTRFIALCFAIATFSLSSESCDSFAHIVAATKQLYEWFSPSVRLSVCLSVCPSVWLFVRHTFLTMFPSSYHHEIFRRYYQWQKWRPCKRSRSQVKDQGHRGHNHTEPFPDCNSSLNSHMMLEWCTKLDVA